MKKGTQTFIGKFIVALTFVLALAFTHSAYAATITWDGGGATENWSEAANWSTNTVPLAADDIIFNGTSTKNVTVDVNVTTSAFNINAGYTGIISQGASNITFNAPFTQNTGTFTGGSGTLDFNSACIINNGTFTASSGNNFHSNTFDIRTVATYNHNNGTTIFDGSFFLEFQTSVTFNNVSFNFSGFLHNRNNTTITVNGNFDWVNGQLNNGTWNPKGNVSIAATADGGSSILLLDSTTPRTVNFPAGASFPQITVNSANETLTTSGIGTITFAQRFTLQNNASFTPSNNLTFNGNYIQNGGILDRTSNDLTFNNGFEQNSGTFTGGSGTLDFNTTCIINNGTFTASSGNNFHSNGFDIRTVATYNHNNGTTIFDASFFLEFQSSVTFNNVSINAPSFIHNRNNTTVTVNGNFNWINGQLNNGTWNPKGNVSIAATADGGSANMLFDGTANQTYTNSGGINTDGIWTINKPSGTVNLASDLNLSNGTNNLNLTSGTITTGTNTVIAGTRNIVRTSGFVIGNLRRTFTASGSQVFDVGTINGYAPATIIATAGTFGSTTTFTVGGINGTLAGAGFATSLTRNWSLTPSSGGITTANITFNYLQTDVPVTANEANFVFLKRNGGVTLTQGITSINTTANNATLNGVSSFSDWSLGLLTPSASNVGVTGKVLTDTGRGISRARISITDMNGNSRTAITNPFGNYRFNELTVGEGYIISVSHKRYTFVNPTQTIFPNEDLTDVNFTALNQTSNDSKLAIEGRVTDSDGNALSDVRITLSNGNFKQPIIVKTDKKGFYSFENLTVGETYFVTVNSKIYTFANPTKVITLVEDLTDADFLSGEKR